MNERNYDKSIYIKIKEYKALILNEQRTVRAKNYGWIDNENVSLFHLFKEHKAASFRNIDSIILNDVKHVGTGNMCKVFQTFFQKCTPATVKMRCHRCMTSRLGNKLVTIPTPNCLKNLPIKKWKCVSNLCQKNKSLGPDGLSAEFYVTMWEIKQKSGRS